MSPILHYRYNFIQLAYFEPLWEPTAPDLTIVVHGDSHVRMVQWMPRYKKG